MAATLTVIRVTVDVVAVKIQARGAAEIKSLKWPIGIRIGLGTRGLRVGVLISRIHTPSKFAFGIIRIVFTTANMAAKCFTG